VAESPQADGCVLRTIVEAARGLHPQDVKHGAGEPLGHGVDATTPPRAETAIIGTLDACCSFPAPRVGASGALLSRISHNTCNTLKTRAAGTRILQRSHGSHYDHDERVHKQERILPHLTMRDVLVLLLGLSVAPAVFLGRIWKANADRGGQQPAEPFRIAGNFYYVGANDVTSFLITGPEGHVLLDGGYPGTAPMIIASITKLGFDIKDVKVLLNSVPRGDHAGGLAALQQASGAELWASDASAYVIASGGDDPDLALPLRALVQIGILRYPPARVDHRLKDGDTIQVGPIALTAHVTGGSTRGCTSWSFAVRDGVRLLNVVSACGLDVVLGMQYPEQRADIERSLRVLRSLPADIWVTSRARPWGRYRKFVASKTAKNPVDPFIDPEGYRAFIDTAEEEFRRGVVH
jgi:metallo-beta-lactamase class B